MPILFSCHGDMDGPLDVDVGFNVGLDSVAVFVVGDGVVFISPIVNSDRASLCIWKEKGTDSFGRVGDCDVDVPVVAALLRMDLAGTSITLCAKVVESCELTVSTKPEIKRCTPPESKVSCATTPRTVKTLPANDDS